MRYKEAMGSASVKKRMHVIFSGRVQGVGFRYTVCHISEPFHVTGFVRNLWDGNVEVVAEGLKEELTDFLHAIQTSRLARNIFNVHVNWTSALDKFDRFGISY